jgi:hypothetical protein
MALLVLQRMNDVPQRAIVFADRAGSVNHARVESARVAHVGGTVRRGFIKARRHRVAAHIA